MSFSCSRPTWPAKPTSLSAQDPADVEDAPPDLGHAGPGLAADEVLDMDVVEPRRAGPDRAGGIDAGTGRMPDVDA